MMAGLWLGGCILVAYTIEAMSGFGSIVIALSMAALFLPMETLLPVLAALNVLMSSWLLSRHGRHIDKALLFKTILPLMSLGTVAGIALRDLLSGPWLKLGFALLLLWFAGRELWRLRLAQSPRPHGELKTGSFIGFAGITHGLFASGGPLLVYALAGRQLDKATFRATLIAVWWSLNLLLSVVFFWQGRLLPALPQIALYSPLLFIGVWLGGLWHQRLDEGRFRQMIYGLLLLTGLALLLAQLPMLLAHVW